MNEITYTLIAGGSSDKVFLRIIKWCLDDLYPKLPTKEQYADFRTLRNPPRAGDVLGQIKYAENYYPFDICFYHRDAESNDVKKALSLRSCEIYKCLPDHYQNCVVCIIPVRMMETWLLTDQVAIKAAAGNRNYRENLNLPSINTLEQISGPKDLLHNLLVEATGNKGRRLKNFNVNKAVHWVAENTEDFSALRQLAAFNRFEQDLKRVVDNVIRLKNICV